MSAPAVCGSFFWIAVTVASYLLGLSIRSLARDHPLANPALIAIMVVSALLRVSGTTYGAYFRATWIVTFFLAPATVALGVPLAKNLLQVRRNLGGVTVGLLAGSFTSMASGMALVRILGGSKGVALSMLPKAATTPIAMTVAQQVGGQPALTASLAIMGGIVAAITLRTVLRLLKVTHQHAVGLAAGTAGSGIAAAHVAQLGDATAAFAAIGIGLNGVVTALFAPLIAAALY